MKMYEMTSRSKLCMDRGREMTRISCISMYEEEIIKILIQILI